MKFGRCKTFSNNWNRKLVRTDKVSATVFMKNEKLCLNCNRHTINAVSITINLMCCADDNLAFLTF